MTHQTEPTPILRAAIALRPVTVGDEAFLFEVYASTRSDEMSLVPWSDEQKVAFVSHQFNAQQQYYRHIYPEAQHDIIVSNGRMVGRLYVARMDDAIRIVDITILPKERNRAIGGHLVSELIDEAAVAIKPLTIYVETFNPSMRLFERLGFIAKESQGVHVLMERLPIQPVPEPN